MRDDDKERLLSLFIHKPMHARAKYHLYSAQRRLMQKRKVNIIY